MLDILKPVDGSYKNGIKRMRLMMDKETFKNYISKYTNLIFWYNSRVPIDPIDREVYFEAYKCLYGTENVTSIYSATPPISASCINPEALLRNYTSEIMMQLSTYDVLIFCVNGNKYMLPEKRKWVTNVEDAAKDTCFIGAYSSCDERQPILDACWFSNLSCLVIRALSMDNEDESYFWEAEHRVPSVYL